MSVVSVYLTLFNEAKVKFGPVDTWNHYEVGQWMKGRVDALKGGAKPEARPYQPRSFVDVEPVEVGRWDDVEKI